MYQEQVLNYRHFDEHLDEGKFAFECILTGNLQAFAACSWPLPYSKIVSTVLLVPLKKLHSNYMFVFKDVKTEERTCVNLFGLTFFL